MKTRLPKMLLAALLAAMAVPSFAQSKYTPERPYHVEDVKEENTDITASIASYQGHLTQADDRANKAGCYVKDGSAIALITDDINMDTRLVVREGTVKMTNATITQKSDGNFDFLVVGGAKINDTAATLELDNAKIIQTDKGYSGFMKTVSVGTKDGEGQLILKNGSVVKSGQLFHVGYPEYVNTGHGTYTNTSCTENYFTKETPSHGTLIVESGSKVYAGQGFYFADADISLSGEGTEFIGASRAIGTLTSRMGHMADATTNVTVKDGAIFHSYDSLNLANKSGATVNVTIDGNSQGLTGTSVPSGATFAAYNKLNAATGTGDSAGGTVVIEAKNNATLHIGNATLSTNDGTGNSVTVNIDATSKYTGSALTVNKGATFTNNGTVELATETVVTNWHDNLNNSYTNTAIAAAGTTTVGGHLTINGGTLTNAGTITVEDLTLGTGSLTVKSGASLTVTGTLTFHITEVPQSQVYSLAPVSGGSSAVLTVEDNGTLTLTNVDNLEVTFSDEVINAVLGLENKYEGGDNSEGTTLDVVFNVSDYIDVAGDVDADLATELATKLASTVEQELIAGWGDDYVAVLGATSGEGGSVTVTLQYVPEPATATLSLLALAGLAARRRRK